MYFNDTILHNIHKRQRTTILSIHNFIVTRNRRSLSLATHIYLCENQHLAFCKFPQREKKSFSEGIPPEKDIYGLEPFLLQFELEVCQTETFIHSINVTLFSI